MTKGFNIPAAGTRSSMAFYAEALGRSWRSRWRETVLLDAAGDCTILAKSSARIETCIMHSP